jgi:Zn-dependent peptidase ImmA (M78 family)
MPRNLIEEAAFQIDRTKWPNLYDLAKRFNVTISALRVRLEQLDLLYVDNDNTLYESRDHKFGQKRMF